MKFKLLFQIPGEKNIIPVNYQYEFSAWIYKTLNFGNAEFARWLHDQGYVNGNKRFKLFTFSRLFPDKYSVQKDRLEILSNQSVLYISLL